MNSSDALVVAGDVAAELERHGVVACGRRIDGATHLDVWTRDGRAFKLPVTDGDSVAELVAHCLALTSRGIVSARPSSDLS